MQERVTRMDPLGPSLMPRDHMVEITPGNLPNFVLGAHDNRELFGVMFLAPGPVANEGGEEPGEAESLVRSGGFEMPAERLGSHINTVDRLRIGTGYYRGLPRPLLWLSRRGLPLTRMTRELCE